VDRSLRDNNEHRRFVVEQAQDSLIRDKLRLRFERGIRMFDSQAFALVFSSSGDSTQFSQQLA
jgi:hypothetical protein